MQLRSVNCTFLSDDNLTTLNKLSIHTIEQFIAHGDLESLSRLSKIPIKTLYLAYKYYVSTYSALPQQANELLDKYIRNTFILQFNCKQIDTLLLGGIVSNEVTEVYGGSSTGKTQLCLNLCANLLKTAVKPPDTGLAQPEQPTQPPTAINKCKILYVNVNGSFCIERLVQILNVSSTSIPFYLKHLSVIHCKNAFELCDILFKLEKPSKLHNFTNDVNLIVTNLLIIDNFNVLFNIFRQQNNFDFLSYLHYICKRLKYVAIHLNISVLVTNVYDSDEDKLMLGYAWKSVPSVRVMLKKGEVDNGVVMSLVSHSRKHLTSANSTCIFKIESSGIV